MHTPSSLFVIAAVAAACSLATGCDRRASQTGTPAADTTASMPAPGTTSGPTMSGTTDGQVNAGAGVPVTPPASASSR